MRKKKNLVPVIFLLPKKKEKKQRKQDDSIQPRVKCNHSFKKKKKHAHTHDIFYGVESTPTHTHTHCCYQIFFLHLFFFRCPSAQTVKMKKKKNIQSSCCCCCCCIFFWGLYRIVWFFFSLSLSVHLTHWESNERIEKERENYFMLRLAFSSSSSSSWSSPSYSLTPFIPTFHHHRQHYTLSIGGKCIVRRKKKLNEIKKKNKFSK